MFDSHQSIFDEHGETDHDRVADYFDGLMNEFAQSPEAKPLPEGVHWTGMMLRFAVDYLGATPATMSLGDFKEIVFELFPRKLSTEPENAPTIV
jgi:hypothetical protein